MPRRGCSKCRELIPVGVQVVNVGAGEMGHPVVCCGPCLKPIELGVMAFSCPVCGCEVFSTTWNGSAPYCSITCWRESGVATQSEHAAQRTQEAPVGKSPVPLEPARACVQCAASLEGTQRTARYCSNACKQRAWRERNAAA